MQRIGLLVCTGLFSAAVMAKPIENEKVTALAAAAAGILNGKVLAVARHPAPGFSAMTMGKGALGLIGLAASYPGGNKIVTQNEVADPAYVLEQQLAPAIAMNYSMQVRPGPAPIIEGKVEKVLAQDFAGVDFVLDIRTGFWGFTYVPTNDGLYSVSHGVSVELFEVATGKKLASRACLRNTWDHPSAPNYDRLLANRAQLLKDATASLAWHCMDHGAAKAFGIPQEWLPPIPAKLQDPFSYRGR